MGQKEEIRLARAAIDTARAHGSDINEQAALRAATRYAESLRSSHARRNFGKARYEWLAARGVYILGHRSLDEGDMDIVK